VNIPAFTQILLGGMAQLGAASWPWRLRLDTLAQIAVEAIYAFF